MAKFSFRRSLILVGIGLVAGCVASHDRVALSQLPPAWQDAVSHSNQSLPDVSGVYSDLGEYTHEYAVATGRHPHQRLVHLLFPKIKPAPHAEQVQLTQHGQTQLEISALLKGQVVASASVNIEVDVSSGAVKLPHESGLDAGGSLAAAVAHSGQVVLFKGNDGRLYLHYTASDNGVVAAVVPMAVATENWGRWSLAPKDGS